MKITIRLAIAAALAAFLYDDRAWAQPCIGDCNTDAEVTLGEVQTAFNVFLGNADPPACDEADSDQNGEVTLGEVQSAFNRFLTGCDGGGNVEEVRAASTTTLSSIRGVVTFGHLASIGGGGGGGSYGLNGRLAEGQGGGLQSGCESGECALGGFVDCTCDSDSTAASLAVAWEDCSFEDEFGNVVFLDGEAFLDAADPDICFGAVPFGVDFTSEFIGFFQSLEDQNGNFQVLTADFLEDFVAVDPECVPEVVDPLEFATRGDGVRFIDGTIRTVEGNSFSGETVDITSTATELETDVAFLLEDDACFIDTIVNGSIDVSDAVAGTEFSQSFEELSVVEVDAGDSLFLVGIDGSVSTDCLGGLVLFTSDPLVIAADLDCPIGGRLEVTLESDGSTAAIEFDENGGVGFDLDADGSIDERSASCLDLELSQCGFEEPAGVCTPCTSNEQCDPALGCFPCTFCEDGIDMRCAPPDDFVFCDGDVY